CLGPTYVALRHKGRLRQTQWHYESNLNHLLNRMIEGAIALVSQKAEGIDAIELCFTHTYCSVQLSEFKSTFANIYRGLRGIELQYQDQLERYSPTRMIASNLSFHKILEQFLSRHHLSPQAFVDNGGIIQAFQTRQVFVTLTPDVQALTLHRGNRVVPLEKLSGETLDDLTVQMGQWLLRQIDSDGRMVYKYFPSRGQESNANNLIRQFMATLALIRYAKSTQQSTHWAIAKQNLDYNLTQFYTSDGDLGWVEYEGKAKLGAIALAALAILELSEDPTAHSTPGLTIVPSHQDVFDKLCATIDTLWQSDGSFRTFYKPSDRNDNQNFYPGEALLFWAVLYHRTHDPQLLKRCRISFSYYRDWHRAHYNPAFIPWHTQAYALLYDATGDRSFLEFIFEMNDNLLSMQQWNPESENCHEDVQGRFYDAGADYGPPHASSTGVYLEGLADAYRLAVQAQESARAAAYRTVIWRGLRSVRQLQFRDAVDMFYISKRSVVQGAIRTTVYDNVIRVDNVQHCLMALLRLKQLPAFQPEATPPSVDDQTPSALLAIAPHSSDSAAELTHFRVMHQTVDIQPLIKELAANSQLWHHDTSRQDNINVQRETNSIYLRSAVKPFPPGITNSNDVHASHRTRVSDHFPQILNWVEQFATAQDGELGRVTIVRLAPRGRVYRHIDHGEYYRLRDRYHLVLHSSAGSLLGAGDEWICMQPGECWWFNNKAPHEAYNPSDDWRIHLIFDVQHKGRSELDRPSV
ncbi:MAG: aspartyl/asparaginyl beta-hydroxylase domain-containing protein, partial [Cyanobacteria bacterium J06633_2]